MPSPFTVQDGWCELPNLLMNDCPLCMLLRKDPLVPSLASAHVMVPCNARYHDDEEDNPYIE
jgi:hypothetical protein